MFCLRISLLLLFAQGMYTCEFSNYEDFTSVYIAPYVSEGIGDISLSSNRILASGTTAVEGSVPVTGGVNFKGPVRAVGTVAILGGSWPPKVTQLSQSIGSRTSPYTPTTKTILRRTFFTPITITKSNFPRASLFNRPAVSLPDALPTVSLPVTETMPEILLPVENNIRFGKVSVSTPMMGVSGSTQVEGVVPITGEVKFSGVVPAKGSVHISCTCAY